MFKRGSTPTYVLKLKDEYAEKVDLTLANHVYVTFEQGKYELRKQDGDLEVTSNTITLHLTQAETLSFKKGTVSIEINVTYDEGGRAISETYSDSVLESVEDRELE